MLLITISISHIVLNSDVNTFLYYISSIKLFLCEVVVAASCLLSSEKQYWNTAWRRHDFVDEFIPVSGNALKCSNAITSIDTDIFSSYYFDCIWWIKLATNLSSYSRWHRTSWNYWRHLNSVWGESPQQFSQYLYMCNVKRQLLILWNIETCM